MFEIVSKMRQSPKLRTHAPSDVPASVRSSFDDVLADVILNDWVNAEYKRIRFAAPHPTSSAQAGQFFNIECPATGEDQPYLRRPMSTYLADPEVGELEFLYKVTGAGTRGLATLRPGMQTRLLGPLGNGFVLQPEWRNIVVLGRGVGLATLAPLAELAAARGVGVTALISARGREQVLSLDRFEAIDARTEVVLDSDGTSGRHEICIHNFLLFASLHGAQLMPLIVKTNKDLIHIPRHRHNRGVARGLRAGKHKRIICFLKPVYHDIFLLPA